MTGDAERTSDDVAIPSADAGRARLDSYELTAVPGHLLRRWQQRALDIYLQEVGVDGPTPRQFAVLVTIHQNPGLSQTALVGRTGIDRSTIADMINRLVGRGLVRRTRTSRDQRTNALHITEDGLRLIARAVAAVDRAQERILAPIPLADQPQFLAALARILELPEDSAVPGED